MLGVARRRRPIALLLLALSPVFLPFLLFLFLTITLLLLCMRRHGAPLLPVLPTGRIFLQSRAAGAANEAGKGSLEQLPAAGATVLPRDAAPARVARAGSASLRGWAGVHQRAPWCGVQHAERLRPGAARSRRIRRAVAGVAPLASNLHLVFALASSRARRARVARRRGRSRFAPPPTGREPFEPGQLGGSTAPTGARGALASIPRSAGLAWPGPPLPAPPAPLDTVLDEGRPGPWAAAAAPVDGAACALCPLVPAPSRLPLHVLHAAKHGCDATRLPAAAFLLQRSASGIGGRGAWGMGAAGAEEIARTALAAVVRRSAPTAEAALHLVCRVGCRVPELAALRGKPLL